MFWWNLTKIGQIYIPYEFAQSGSIPPKIKCETEADEGSQTIHATPEVYLASWNRKPIGQRDLLASTKMDQDFPGKVTHCRHVYFLSRSHRRALKRTTQYWAKLLKVKEKPAAKMEKLQTVLRSKTMSRHTAFKITIRGDSFLSRLVLAWRGGASFLTSYIASFGSTATSLFKIRTPAWSSTSISRFHRGIIFPFFIQRTFFRFWFSMSKDFSEKKKFHAWILLSERCKQNMETTWKSNPNMNGCRENSLRQFAQIRDYDTFLIY